MQQSKLASTSSFVSAYALNGWLPVPPALLLEIAWDFSWCRAQSVLQHLGQKAFWSFFLHDFNILQRFCYQHGIVCVWKRDLSFSTGIKPRFQIDAVRLLHLRGLYQFGSGVGIATVRWIWNAQPRLWRDATLLACVGAACTGLSQKEVSRWQDQFWVLLVFIHSCSWSACNCSWFVYTCPSVTLYIWYSQTCSPIL